MFLVLKKSLCVLRNSGLGLVERCTESMRMGVYRFADADIADRTDGVGPIGNIMSQAENDRTGTYCALLSIYGWR